MSFTRRCCRLFLSGLSLAVAASACTANRRGIQRLASSHLADTATSYNLAIEQAQDEMLLLNVIRAQDNYPRYITDATKVTGTVKADLTLGLKLPLLHAGSANGNDYFGMPSLEYSSSPSMDVNLLNTKDFMDGFLAPIQPERFAYYWEQGWPSELLLYLMVLRVDRYKIDSAQPSQPISHFDNQPYSLKALPRVEEFSGWIKSLVKEGRPHLCKGAVDAAVGPPLASAPQLSSLKYLVPVAKEEGLSLDPATADKGKWQLNQPRKVYSLRPGRASCPEEPPAGSPNGQPEGERLSLVLKGHIAVWGATDKTTVDVLRLRSPEGMLYYLGQLARLENRTDRLEDAKALLIHGEEYDGTSSEPDLEPLFVALEKKRHHPCPHIIIWVRALDGHDYLIPREEPEDPRFQPTPQEAALGFANAQDLCATGETMHSLELLSQLISLQKSAKDLTTTATVKVVGE